jgi:hypothetical protein
MRAFGLALGATSALFVAQAQAQVAIPTECGSEVEFRRQLGALLARSGAELEAALPSELRIESPDSRGIRRMRLVVQGERRELEDPDCRTLVKSAVVIAAAAARPLGSPAEDLPGASPAATPAPTPSEPGRRAAPAVPRPTSRAAVAQGSREESGRPMLGEEVAYTVAVGAGITGGVVPGVGAVLELRGSKEPRPLGVAIGARFWPRENASREGRAVDVSAVGLRAGGLLRLAPVVQLGAGLELNRFSGEGGANVPGRGSDDAWHLAANLELSAVPWQVGDLRLELGVSGRVSLVRPLFLIQGFGEVYRVPGVGADAIIRGVWLFR